MKNPSLPATVAALGVVFGDIGTSPLYAFRETVLAAPDRSAAATLGALSLVTWTIVLAVAVKYVGLVLRRDNDGEGGILALASLLGLSRRGPGRNSFLLLVAILGAAMLFGDGVITPAISVVSAIEGLAVVEPRLEPAIVPIAVAVLIGIFAVQRAGGGRIARFFGPVMLVWFAALAALGLAAVVARPAVLVAVDPRLGLALLADHPGHALPILGAVFLAVTGGEALYADLGLFGRRVIARAWFWIAMPALLLNYAGQAALVLEGDAGLANPFYELAPHVLRLPLLVLATAATVIASQAVISGVFSLARQAIQMGFLVPVAVRHTAAENESHVYLPLVNGVLAVLSIAVVLGFRSSDALADAYGIAVAAAMISTTVLFVALAWRSRSWPRPVVAAVGTGLLALDLAFFTASLGKIDHGGWLPLAIAATAAVIMLAWRHGAEAVEALVERVNRPLEEYGHRCAGFPKIDRPAVFLTRNAARIPMALTQFEQHFGHGFSRLAVVSVDVAVRPRVAPAERIVARRRGGTPSIEVGVGYMQPVNLPSLLAPALRAEGMDPEAVVYVLGFERPLAPERIRTPGDLLAALYVLLQRNALRQVDRYALPPKRTIEVGIRFPLKVESALPH